MATEERQQEDILELSLLPLLLLLRHSIGTRNINSIRTAETDLILLVSLVFG